MNVEITSGAGKNSFFARTRTKFLHLLRLTDRPVVRLYTGYGNKTHCYLYGHVFDFSPIPRTRYRHDLLINAISLLRLFMVKTKAGATLQFTWEDKKYIAHSEKDGFFKFEW